MDKLKESFTETLEKLKNNKFYVGLWCVALLTIVAVNITTKTSYKFVGVTDSKEVNINSKHAVVIKSINVLPGQAVKQGQLLLELKREDLTLRINEVSGKLEELTAQFKLNAELNSNIKSLRKYKKRKTKKKINEKEEDDLLSIQMRSLEKELQLLYKEKEELYIFSSFDGNIGSINYKVGESVSPFDPIMTMHKKTPTVVRGYIHEKLSHKVEVNKKVVISSLNTTGSKIIASVKSVGNRIIEFPERFRRSAAEKIWGREVIIQIPENNPFLLGEKVFMELSENEKVTIMSRTIADDIVVDGNYDYNTINIDRGDFTENLIEPSGVIYIKDLNKSLMISDDNIEDKPLLYLLNSDGSLDPHVIAVEGLDSIKDMEAIAQDKDDNIYLISSQSPNKKGKVTSARKLLVKAQRNGVNVKMTAKVSLYDLLNKLAKKNKYAPWVKFLKSSSKTRKKGKVELDVEGMVYSNGDLLLGLRNPVGRKKEVAVLRITNIDKVFTDSTLERDQVALAKVIELPTLRKDDRHEGISDLMIHEDDLIIVTANNRGKNKGRVLKTSLSQIDGEVIEIVHYSDHKPEGITLDEKKGEFIVVFDTNDAKGKVIMSKFSGDLK